MIMPKKIKIIDKLIEKYSDLYRESWDAGKFQHNYSENKTKQNKQVSLWRIWNVFIEPIFRDIYEVAYKEGARDVRDDVLTMLARHNTSMVEEVTELTQKRIYPEEDQQATARVLDKLK